MRVIIFKFNYAHPRRSRVIITFLCCLYVSAPAFADRIVYSLGIETGIQPNLGQGFISANTSANGLGEGIDAMNVEKEKLKTDGLSRPGGILFFATNRLLLLNTYFVGLDLGWVDTLYGSSGSYQQYKDARPLQIDGRDVRSLADFHLRSFQMPFNFGSMLSFWEETIIFLGGGLGYAYYLEDIIIRADEKKPDFQTHSAVSGSALFYHFFIEYQYKVAGYGKSTPVYLSAKFSYIYGTDGWQTDTVKTGENPKTSQTHLVGTDSVLVNLSGFRFSIGVNFRLASFGVSK